MKRFDFVAIGGGSAGLTAAALVRAAGQTAAVIDRGPIGGLCSLNGCNPKKVLVRSSEVLDEVRRAREFGVDVGEIKPDWSRVIDRKESFTRGVTQATEDMLRQQDISLIRDAPRFVSAAELEVNGETITAKAFLVATGSRPRQLSFKGAEFVKTSDQLLAALQVPARLFIVGAGVVAFEFGQVFARLGSKVVMITPDPRPLLEHDADIVSALVEFSKTLGIEVFVGAKVKGIRREDRTLQVEIEADGRVRRFEADFVLNAAGRPPAIDDLALERASVKADPHGVVVDEYLRSPSNRAVFAAGDAHGRFQLSPIASYEGRVAARNFLDGDVERVSYESIPSVVYAVPPLAAVGMTEAAARDKGIDIAMSTSDMSTWKVFAIAGERAAKAKVIVESRSGRVLGAHLFGRAADEDIHIFSMAIRFGISADQLRTMVYAYPTFASALPFAVPDVASARPLRKTG